MEYRTRNAEWETVLSFVLVPGQARACSPVMANASFCRAAATQISNVDIRKNLIDSLLVGSLISSLANLKQPLRNHRW